MDTHGFGHTWIEKKPSQTWRPLTSHRKNILQRPICLEGIQVSIVKGISEGFKELYSKKWSCFLTSPVSAVRNLLLKGVPRLVPHFQESKNQTHRYIEFWPKKHNKSRKEKLRCHIKPQIPCPESSSFYVFFKFSENPNVTVHPWDFHLDGPPSELPLDLPPSRPLKKTRDADLQERQKS